MIIFFTVYYEETGGDLVKMVPRLVLYKEVIFY